MIDVHGAFRAEIDGAGGRGDDGTRCLRVHVVDDLKRHALHVALIFHERACRHALRAGAGAQVRVELHPEQGVGVVLPLQVQ